MIMQNNYKKQLYIYKLQTKMKLYFTITYDDVGSFTEFSHDNHLPYTIEGTYCLDSSNSTLTAITLDQVPHDCLLKWDRDYIEKMYKNEVIGRFNQGKLQWTLMNHEAFKPMIEVLMYGVERYDRDNWMKVCPKKNDLLDSLERHYVEIKEPDASGIVYDHGSRLRSIGHLMCNAMFYSYWEQKTNGQFENADKQ